jgi:hypothetical protein
VKWARRDLRARTSPLFVLSGARRAAIRLPTNDNDPANRHRQSSTPRGAPINVVCDGLDLPHVNETL